MERRQPALQAFVPAASWQLDEGQLHQMRLFALYNHASGFFARAEVEWYSRTVPSIPWSLQDPIFVRAKTKIPSEEFPSGQPFCRLIVPRLHGDLTLGVLNLTGEDYRLNPINHIFRTTPGARILCSTTISILTRTPGRLAVAKKRSAGVLARSNVHESSVSVLSYTLRTSSLAAGEDARAPTFRSSSSALNERSISVIPFAGSHKNIEAKVSGLLGRHPSRLVTFHQS